jgi:hypothetical protein
MPRKKPSSVSTQLVPAESIERRIYQIRGHKVMLDNDLATLYGVSTKRLNEQVRRNLKRFPPDFMIRLTLDEAAEIIRSRSQFATLKRGQNIKYAPYAFTEHGAVMLASVLNSPTAIDASIQVVRVFIRLREMLATHKELAQKLEQLEKKYDAQFRVVFDAIRKLMEPPSVSRRRIGFHSDDKQ